MFPTLSSTRWGTLSPATFATARREMDEAFQRLFGQNGQRERDTRAVYAPLSLWEDEEHVYVDVDVPGFRHDDLDVTFREGKLWISGERKLTERTGTVWHNERVFGRFERAIALPETIDHSSIEAELEDGVLHLTLAKRPEAKPVKIAINANGNGNGQKSQRKRLTSRESSET